MSDEKDFGFEETKSAIFDYYVLFKEVQGTLIWIIVGSVFSSIHSARAEVENRVMMQMKKSLAFMAGPP